MNSPSFSAMLLVSISLLVACNGSNAAPQLTARPTHTAEEDQRASPVAMGLAALPSPSSTSEATVTQVLGTTLTPRPKTTPTQSAVAASQFPCVPTVEGTQVLLSKDDRERLNLRFWPDGNIGATLLGSNFTLFAANSGKIGRLVGTLDNPVQESVQTGIQIEHLKTTLNYAGGGPVYQDPGSGLLLIIYHGEVWSGSDPTRFTSLLGMAKSTDNGNSWADLGPIIMPNGQSRQGGTEVGGGAFLLIGGYFYIYFRDTLETGAVNEVAVARAGVAEVISAANNNQTVRLSKYFNGAWSEPGLGGRSSPLEPGNPQARWLDVSYNEAMKGYIMVVASNKDGSNVFLYLTQSWDGLTWGPRQVIQALGGENFYPTIIGANNKPRTSGERFYVIHTRSTAGGFQRWTDALVMRMLLSCVPPKPNEAPK